MRIKNERGGKHVPSRSLSLKKAHKHERRAVFEEEDGSLFAMCEVRIGECLERIWRRR